MRAGDLKPGQWFLWNVKSRLCIGQANGFVRESFSANQPLGSIAQDEEVELLPPDAGYDYVMPKPIDPGDGWRLVGVDELLEFADEHKIPDDPNDRWAKVAIENVGQPCGPYSARHPVTVVRRRVTPQATVDPLIGYRALGIGEKIEAGNEYLSCNNEWLPSMSVGIRMLDSHRPIRRRIAPKYRPFTGAAEFAPHRDRWLRQKDGFHVCSIVGYRDNGVWCLGERASLAYGAMVVQYVFDDDGLPVGVEVKP